MIKFISALRTLLSRQFKAYRKHHGLTQEVMAGYLHISARSYIDLERGRSLCSTKVFIFFIVRLTQEDMLLLWEALKTMVEQLQKGAA